MDGIRDIEIKHGKGISVCDGVHVSVPYSVEADVSPEAKAEAEKSKSVDDYNKLSDEAKYYVDTEQGREHMGINSFTKIIASDTEDASLVRKIIREINKSDRAYQVSYGHTEKAHFPAVLIQEDGSVTASRLPMKEHLEDATSPDYYQVWIKRDHQTVSEINRKNEEEHLKQMGHTDLKITQDKYKEEELF